MEILLFVGILVLIFLVMRSVRLLYLQYLHKQEEEKKNDFVCQLEALSDEELDAQSRVLEKELSQLYKKCEDILKPDQKCLHKQEELITVLLEEWKRFCEGKKPFEDEFDSKLNIGYWWHLFMEDRVSKEEVLKQIMRHREIAHIADM